VKVKGWLLVPVLAVGIPNSSVRQVAVTAPAA
jgi:hypothetical protein